MRKKQSLELSPAREGEINVDAEDTDEHSTFNTASTKRQEAKFASGLTTSFLSTAESGTVPDNTLCEISQDPVIVAARLPFKQIKVFRLINRGGFGEEYYEG